MRAEVEIVPLREHRHITQRCPNCQEFRLMDVRRKTRVHGKVNYYVTCLHCSHDFKQLGQPYNFWRDVKQRYALASAQLRSMQNAMIRKLVETGEVVATETKDTIRTGDVVFIKPNRRDAPR